MNWMDIPARTGVMYWELHQKFDSFLLLLSTVEAAGLIDDGHHENDILNEIIALLKECRWQLLIYTSLQSSVGRLFWVPRGVLLSLVFFIAVTAMNVQLTTRWNERKSVKVWCHQHDSHQAGLPPAFCKSRHTTRLQHKSLEGGMFCNFLSQNLQEDSNFDRIFYPVPKDVPVVLNNPWDPKSIDRHWPNILCVPVEQ